MTKTSLAAVVTAFFVLLAGLIWWQSQATGGSLEGMPLELRKPAFTATLRHFAEVCEPKRKDSLEKLCEEEAETLARFPECDAECQQRIAPYLGPWPTR